MQAARLKQDFYQGWNGAGPAAKDYAKRIEEHKYAVEDPRNQALTEYIRKVTGYKDPNQTVAQAGFKRGGGVKMPEQYAKDGNWKLI